MARIRVIEIQNFRGIQHLTWFPSPGLNCLIGPGDTGKSSILDAIDLCLGARRNIQFSDADFYRLNVETPINISVTLGELEEGLKNLDTYGMYLRSFDSETRIIEDEPENDAETVLTVRLTVASDLEPSWSLVSERAEEQEQKRNLVWGDRVQLAPTRIGVMAAYHLGWRRGSVLNRLSEESVDASAALASAARDARAAFGDEAEKQLGETLAVVVATAGELGIPIGENIRALLDAHSVTFSGGTISLHDENGVPLGGLGIGSTRLLTAGLQRKAATNSRVILIDELEHGLEPHRIIRLLGSLGAKEDDSPLQVFMTTHSPVALRELSGSQLNVTRPSEGKHEVLIVGTDDDVQSTIRLYPDAFLAASIIICEGASEVGFVRGLDQYRVTQGHDSISAQGTALVDSGGGDVNTPFARAAAFQALGYRTAIVRDDDQNPDTPRVKAFIANGGKLVKWRNGRTLEDELFWNLTDDGICKLIDYAVDLHGEKLIGEHIKSASRNRKNLDRIRAEIERDELSERSCELLGKAARMRKAGWFKSVTSMEYVARNIVAPDLKDADEDFTALIDEIFTWSSNDGG